MTDEPRIESLEAGDIVQVDPESEMGKTWGSQLCVVSEVKPWGVQCYFVHAAYRGEFGAAYLRLATGTYKRVGRAVWVAS